ncbi:MAG: GGDEF domain-containing protein [Pseudomonadota bacterium]|nr:GGDEF domain-containing protein [Pseudomonadota bacterium]
MTQANHKRTDEDLAQLRVSGEIPVPVLIGWLTLAAIPTLAFFAYRSYLREEAHSTPVLIFFLALLALNGLVYLVTRREALQRRSFIAIVTGLFVFFAITALEEGSAIIWMFAYPPVIFYISTPRTGIIACAGGLLAAIILFSPLGDAIFNTPYGTSFRVTMVAVLMFEMGSCYALDQSRRRAKARLLKLAAEFEYAANHDALTNLANRREGMDLLEVEYERYLRNGRPFSVVLLDIDLFKNVNDEFGHQAGDEVIVRVAQTLKNECRKVDTIARWGGEEYLALLPETGASEALQTGERFREAIYRNPVSYEGREIPLTVSAGVATIRGSESIDRLLQRADEALYQAKGQGRNRVFYYDGSAS